MGMDHFLERFLAEKVKVTIRSSGGDYVAGIVRGFNNTIIWLETEYQQEAVINKSLVTSIFAQKK
ncbi:MAG: hypothetical protein DDT29_01899 [Dehalococcoidia bacterium]|nr:hypothetical protein [Bacillota bacterium]